MAVTNWQLQKLPHLLWIEAFHLVWNHGIKGGRLLMTYLYCRIILVSFPRYCCMGMRLQNWIACVMFVICDDICGGELGTRLDEPYSTNIRICCLPLYFPNYVFYVPNPCALGTRPVLPCKNATIVSLSW